MAKKIKERPTHKVSFKENPIWFTGNFAGKYDGINFGFVYREYCDKEAGTVSKSFKFTWPGRIPEDLAGAEEGISKLFLSRKENATLNYNVLLDEYVENAIEEEDELVTEYINNIKEIPLDGEDYTL